MKDSVSLQDERKGLFVSPCTWERLRSISKRNRLPVEWVSNAVLTSGLSSLGESISIREVKIDDRKLITVSQEVHSTLKVKAAGFGIKLEALTEMMIEQGLSQLESAGGVQLTVVFN